MVRGEQEPDLPFNELLIGATPFADEAIWTAARHRLPGAALPAPEGRLAAGLGPRLFHSADRALSCVEATVTDKATQATEEIQLIGPVINCLVGTFRRGKHVMASVIRIAVCLTMATVAAPAFAGGDGKSGAMALTPSEMKWASSGNLALPGMEQVILVGDPSKPGPYTLRLKFPSGYKLAPHSHPDAREITVLSGTWCIGYGEKVDPAALKELPAGSFFTEPANVAHFLEMRGDVVVQVSGMGPSGRKFVDATVAKQ